MGNKKWGGRDAKIGKFSDAARAAICENDVTGTLITEFGPMTYSTTHEAPRSSLVARLMQVVGRICVERDSLANDKTDRAGLLILQSAKRREDARRAVDVLLKRGF